MKKVKLSVFIQKLEDLKKTAGDISIYPVYHDNFDDSVKFVKRASLMSGKDCQAKFKGYFNNVITEDTPKAAMFLVFED